MDVHDPDVYDSEVMPAPGWSRYVLFLGVLSVLVTTGCGANTGIPVPDLYRRDAGQPLADAGVDAGPDAGPVEECFDIPLDGGPIQAAMTLEAEVGRADVVLLIDITSSMQEEITAIRTRLRDRIAPAIREAIPDSQLAVTTHADFPRAPYGQAGRDEPFTLVSPSTADVARIQAAVDSIRLGSGVDPPESQVEALFQIATGAGLTRYIPASGGCPSGGVGYACIRRDALPVILLFTDEVMHNGPSPSTPFAYDPGILGVSPHTFTDAVNALNAINARVIGFDSGNGSGAPDLRTLAVRTGTVDGSGRPLVFDIGSTGSQLGNEVVNAVRTFASTVIQDVDAVVRDADASDGIDARTLVEAVVPLRAEPMSGVSGIDTATNTFLDVSVGTMLSFSIVVRPGIVVPGTEPKIVRAEVVFRGNRRTRIGSQVIWLVVPAADGRGCDDL